VSLHVKKKMKKKRGVEYRIWERPKQTSEERGRCVMKCIQGSNEYRAASSIFNPFPSSLIMGKRVRSTVCNQTTPCFVNTESILGSLNSINPTTYRLPPSHESSTPFQSGLNTNMPAATPENGNAQKLQSGSLESQDHWQFGLLCS